jgi:hypothetical protein
MTKPVDAAIWPLQLTIPPQRHRCRIEAPACRGGLQLNAKAFGRLSVSRK